MPATRFHTFRKTLLATSIALTLGTANVEAALVTNVFGTNTTYSTDSGNFTMLDSNGGIVGGSNNIVMVWDGSAFSDSSDYSGPGSVSNVIASATAPSFFFGHTWTSHDVQMFLPGTYSFDVTLGGGNPETGMLDMTVGAGQVGLHMLFDWYGNTNVDVAMVFDINSVFGSGLLYSTQTNSKGQYTCDSGYTGTITQNCLYDGPNYTFLHSPPVKDQVWMLASADGNGDGVRGIPMAAVGPFAGFSMNISALAPTAVPVPAAAWLFGSGLMGLVASARRRRRP